MQKPFVFPLLLTLTFGCGAPAPVPPAPAAIVLDFQPLSAAEMATFHDDFEIRDTLRQYIKPSDFMLLTIQNNAYDTLWIYQLQKFGPTGRVYQSDGWDEYDIVGDSIYTEWTAFKCYFGSDSDVRLLKGQSIRTYFEGKCGDGVKIFAYSFSFMADSLGIRKQIHFRQFPCKHHYKMDNVSRKTIH